MRAHRKALIPGPRPAQERDPVRASPPWRTGIDAAWHQARTGGCSDGLLLELARRRAEDHPADALPIYLSAIDATLVHADKRAYEQAVVLLGSTRRLFIRLGRTEEFGACVAGVREANKRRKNLLKLLDRAGWGRP